MQRPARDPREPVLSGLFVWRILFVSSILVAATFTLFLLDRAQGASIEHSRTVAPNTLVTLEIFYLFDARCITAPVLHRDGLPGNPNALLATGVLIVFQLAFTYLPIANALFGTAPLGADNWLSILLVGSSVLWLVELVKLWLQRRRSRSRA